MLYHVWTPEVACTDRHTGRLVIQMQLVATNRRLLSKA